MDAFIFPSKWEGFGRVSIEAQTNGLKVFCSSVILKETDISRTSEFISLEEKPEEWAKIITKYAENYNIKDRKSFFNHSYDIKDVAKQMGDFYENSCV